MYAEDGARDSRGFTQRIADYIKYRRQRFELDRSRPLRRRRIAAAAREAEAYFQATDLRRRIVGLMPRSTSTGAEWPDYHLLHRYVMTRKPARVLELGSGVTTLVTSGAMAEAAEADPRYEPRLYTLEDIPTFHENVKALIPVDLASRVTFLCSPRRETRWRDQIWGFCYSDLPAGRFDLVFVDGPTEYRDAEGKRQGKKGANLDLLFLLERDPDARFDVIVDRRLNSLEAYQSVLPRGTVRYDPVRDVGVIPSISGRLLKPSPSASRLSQGRAPQLLKLAE